MIESDARQKLCIELDIRGYELLDGTVTMEKKDNNFWNFKVDFKVLEKPWSHTVSGFITSFGKLTMVSYKLGSDSKPYREFKD